MTTFLTSQEIQELINIDRSTVYRMAEDGRLPGVKVGRQWRFPADQVAAQFGLTPSEPAAERPATQNDGFDQLLRPEIAQSVADLVADLFGVMAVVTDMDGIPKSTVANPCGYFAAIAEQPAAVEACVSQWRRFVDEPHMAPRWVSTHLGFLCARTFIWASRVPVGMIVVGGVRPAVWPPPPDVVESIATVTAMSARTLTDAIDDVWNLDTDAQREVLRLLPQMGDLVSQLASARSDALAVHGGRPVDVHPNNGTNHPMPQGGDRS